MSKSNNLPTYDFYKRLDSNLNFEYSKLEKAYNLYDASSAHRHDYFEIILFNESGGTHEIDFKSFPIKKNSIHIISPGQVHKLRRNKNVTGHVLAFKEEVFVPNKTSFSDEHFFLIPSNVPVLNPAKKEKEKIEIIISGLTEEYDSDHPFKSQSVSAYLLLLVIELMKMNSHSSESPFTSASKILYDRFRKLVDKHIMTKHSVAEYAAIMNISAGHLNDTVKNESGKNASEIIHERLILESKRLLYHSTMSIKEISSLLNYEDPSYFNRFFKSHAGSTPKEFRDEVRKK